MQVIYKPVPNGAKKITADIPSFRLVLQEFKAHTSVPNIKRRNMCSTFLNADSFHASFGESQTVEKRRSGEGRKRSSLLSWFIYSVFLAKKTSLPQTPNQRTKRTNAASHANEVKKRSDRETREQSATPPSPPLQSKGAISQVPVRPVTKGRLPPPAAPLPEYENETYLHLHPFSLLLLVSPVLATEKPPNPPPLPCLIII